MKVSAICFLTCLMFSTVFAAESPIDKGSVIVNGQLSITSLSGDLFEDNEGDGIKIYAITPGVSVFIAKGFMIGADLAVFNATWDDYEANLIGIGPTIGYYFGGNKAGKEIRGSVYTYIKAYAHFQSVKIDYRFTDEEGGNILYGAKAGMNIMMTNSAAIDVGVTYGKVKFSPDDEDDSISGSILSFGLGFTQFIW